MYRRDFLKLALLAPPGAWMGRFNALAAGNKNRVKITAIKALLLQGQWKTLVKIETDAGLSGFGESGVTADMFRSRLPDIAPLLIGEDPLSIEKHFFQMTTQTHHFMANAPTISGIDMALWDLAGKILDRPVSTLLGGPSAIRFNSTGTVSPRTSSTPRPAVIGPSRSRPAREAGPQPRSM